MHIAVFDKKHVQGILFRLCNYLPKFVASSHGFHKSCAPAKEIGSPSDTRLKQLFGLFLDFFYQLMKRGK